MSAWHPANAGREQGQQGRGDSALPGEATAGSAPMQLHSEALKVSPLFHLILYSTASLVLTSLKSSNYKDQAGGSQRA